MMITLTARAARVMMSVALCLCVASAGGTATAATRVLTPEDVTRVRTIGEATATPDGTRVVFRSTQGGKRGLFVRSLDALEPVPIPDSEGGYGPCFSPDGQSVAFFSIFGGARRTGLVRARIEGGTPTLVVELPLERRRGADVHLRLAT